MKRKKKNDLIMQQEQSQANRGAVHCPYPIAPASPFATPVPNATRQIQSGYAVNSIMELPEYVCTDQYGRVYQADVFYGTLPCHAPVPIPMPTKTPQVEPIIIPVQDNKRIN